MTTMHLAKNTDYLADMQGNKFPLIIRSPEMKYKVHFTAAMLRALALAAVQTTTVLIGGTAPDGNYSLRFQGILADGTAVDFTTPNFAASSNTNAQIAAGLEALVQTARAGALAGIVTDETVSTATITSVFTPGAQVTVTLTAPVGATGTIERTYLATVNESTRLRGWPAMAEFYEEVLRGSCILHRIVAVTGLAAVTLVVGDVGDADGLLTSTSLATTGTVQTAGAAENTRRREASFAPQLQIMSTTNPFSSVTDGEFIVEIETTPIPYVIT